jgi:hypothetical protein
LKQIDLLIEFVLALFALGLQSLLLLRQALAA